MTGKLSVADKKWQAQDDVRTLVSADEITTDKKRLGAAEKESATQQAALNKVTKSNKPVAKKKKVTKPKPVAKKKVAKKKTVLKVSRRKARRKR